MKTYDEAQRLFNTYQRNGGIHNLRDALDLLDEIIDSQSTEVQKATNFKKTIGHYITDQAANIMKRCNVLDFARDIDKIENNIDLVREKLAEAMSASFSKEDGEAFIELMTVKKDYF